MPPKQSATLTEAELRIMEVLWHKGYGTVQQVLDWMPSTLAYNSVLTTIRILEKKGGAGTKAFALGRVQYVTGSAAYSNEHIHSTLDRVVAHAAVQSSSVSGTQKLSLDVGN